MEGSKALLKMCNTCCAFWLHLFCISLVLYIFFQTIIHASFFPQLHALWVILLDNLTPYVTNNRAYSLTEHQSNLFTNLITCLCLRATLLDKKCSIPLSASIDTGRMSGTWHKALYACLIFLNELFSVATTMVLKTRPFW